MCQEWIDSYPAFLRDMGRCPVGYQIDRRDNDGPYSKENCRWASRLDQANNTRVNRWFEFRGERHTLAQWSRLTGLKRTTISERVNKGWTVEEALTAPV